MYVIHYVAKNIHINVVGKLGMHTYCMYIDSMPVCIPEGTCVSILCCAAVNMSLCVDLSCSVRTFYIAYPVASILQTCTINH
jgi:hypothetical protein